MSDKIIKFSLLCHRPYSLDGYDKTSYVYKRVIEAIETILHGLEKDDKIVVGLTKLGLGLDQDFAKICLERDISYHVYLPYRNQESLWVNIPDFDLENYQSIIDHSSKCIQVHEGNYSPKKILQTQSRIIKDSDYILYVNGFWPTQSEYNKILYDPCKKLINLNPYV